MSEKKTEDHNLKVRHLGYFHSLFVKIIYKALTALKEELINYTDAKTQILDDIVPDAANKNNQLADKAYVDYNTEQIAAKYLAADAEGHPFLSFADFSIAAAKNEFYYNDKIVKATKNDYILINGDESTDKEEWISDKPPITRYWYTGSTWSFQYIVNNSPLNKSQLEAINSGITKEKVNINDGLADKCLGIVHDVDIIAFKEGENIAEVIMEFFKDKKAPYSQSFFADGTTVQTLKNVPLKRNGKPWGNSCIIKAFCSSGNDIGSYQKGICLEFTTAQSINDTYMQYKFLGKIAGNTAAKPDYNTNPYVQILWELVYTRENFNLDSNKELSKDMNLSKEAFKYFSVYSPLNKITFVAKTDAVASSILQVPTSVTKRFKVDCFAVSGNDVTVFERNSGKTKFDKHIQFELSSFDSSNNPVVYVGWASCSSATEPSTWPTIKWQKILSEAVSDIRN